MAQKVADTLVMKMQPEPAYIGDDGKLHDDGLHDTILASEAGEAASSKAAYDAVTKRGLSETLARRFYLKSRGKSPP